MVNDEPVVAEDAHDDGDDIAYQVALNNDLLDVANVVVECSMKHEHARSGPLWLVNALFSKAVRTFGSIQTLMAVEHAEDAICLLRVLVESTINLAYLSVGDQTELATKYLDWAVLDSLKRARANNGYEATGTLGKRVADQLEEAERSLRKRYPPDQIRALTKSPFGINLEQRARVAGYEKLYQASYRIASRTSHGVDHIELASIAVVGTKDKLDILDLMRSRHVLSVSRFCLGSVLIAQDVTFDCGQSEFIRLLRQRDTFDVTW